MSDYNDIINLSHYRSAKREHMSMHDRAAQFAPFAALTGFEAAITETGRLTDNCTELEEYGKMQLDRALQQLQKRISQQPHVSITYFVADSRKSGGSYISLQGQIKKIDFYHQVITMVDGNNIPLQDIIHIESSLFTDFDF